MRDACSWYFCQTTRAEGRAGVFASALSNGRGLSLSRASNIRAMYALVGPSLSGDHWAMDEEKADEPETTHVIMS
jgi:hypothetical protein